MGGFKHLFSLTVTVVAFPLWLYQGLKLKKTAVRLPEAIGQRQFELKNQNALEKTYKLLVIGDSVAAGVGCDDITNSLAGSLAKTLLEVTGQNIDTQVIAKSGDKLKNTINNVANSTTENGRFNADLVVVSIGVNDAKGFTSTKRWSRQLLSFIELVQKHSPNCHIMIIPTPPLEQFPLIKPALSIVLGYRASRLNSKSIQIIKQCNNTHFYTGEFTTTPEHFASDGFHPNSEACSIIATKIIEYLQSRNVISK